MCVNSGMITEMPRKNQEIPVIDRNFCLMLVNNLLRWPNNTPELVQRLILGLIVLTREENRQGLLLCLLGYVALVT